MRALVIFLSLIQFSCGVQSIDRELASLPSAPVTGEDGAGAVDPTPLPELPPTVPPEQARDIRDQYPFLKSDVFWKRAQEITPIPRSKRCRNTRSYAYFGIVRLVYTELAKSDLSLFPFQTDLRYYRFLDKQEPSKPLDYEIFAQDSLYRKLLQANEETKGNTGRDMTLTGITKHNSFDHDLHCRHRGGNVIDMRPFPGTEPVTWRSKVYDRKANLSFIKSMLAWEKVELIFFNDPEILKDQDVKDIVSARNRAGQPVIFQSAGGHDNHIHIEFKIEGELDRVSTYVFDQLGYSSMIYNFSNEYLYH